MFQKYKRNWKFTAPGSALIVLGIFVIIQGLPLNMGLQLLGLVCLIAGGFLLYYGMKRTSPTSREDPKAAPGGGVAPAPNSICIYAESFDFQYIPDSPGLPWDFTNSGKPYHVLEETPEGWKEFRLPDNREDERYFPPSEYANAATMPATKQYLEWTPSFFQKVAFGLCCAVIVVEAIVLVVLNG